MRDGSFSTIRWTCPVCGEESFRPDYDDECDNPDCGYAPDDPQYEPTESAYERNK